MRRKLIIQLCTQQEKLTTAKNKKKKAKITQNIKLITKQLHNLEILTSQYDEILLNWTRKADANSRHTPLQVMNSIWEANQLAGYVLDYEKYNEFTQVPAIKEDKHPLNEEILTTWTHHDRISTLNAHPQIADNTSKALLNPKSTPKGLVAMQKKRKFRGNGNRNTKRQKFGNKKGGKPFRNNNDNRNSRNNNNGNRQNGNQNQGGNKMNTRRGTNNLRPEQRNNNPFFKCPLHNKLAKKCPPYCQNNPKYDKTKHKTAR